MPQNPLEGLKAAKPVPYPAEAQQVIRENMGEGQQTFPGDLYHTSTDDNLLIPHSPREFSTEPLVNDSDAQNALHNILRVAPQMTHALGKVTMGPNMDAIDTLKKSHFHPEDYSRTNLMGITNRNTHDISLNPGLKRPELDSVLVHEMTHAAGHGETQAKEAGNNFAQGGRDYGPMEDPIDSIIRGLKQAGIKFSVKQ